MSMDGNKDAAQICMDIGNKALKDGDKVRAHKFLSKALRLDPALPLENLVSSLESGVGQQETDLPPHEKTKQNDSHRTNSSNGVGPSESTGDTNTTIRNGSDAQGYTVQQVDIVQRIKRTKDYYRILGLDKDCSSEDIRKAYRKVSLKVHPDKNKAPGADEAFKAVSKAFACLNEPELRKQYDRFGPENAHDVAQQQAYRRHRRNGFVYEDMFDANEIFSSFFNGTPYASSGFQGAHFAGTYRTGGQQGNPRVHTHEVNFGGLMNFLRILPILLLFLFSFFPSSKPTFSLKRSSEYNIRYLTEIHSVPFFVRSYEFDEDYPVGSRSRDNIEKLVEGKYREILKLNCRSELEWRQWDPTSKTPHCDELRQFYVN
jgi:DnaJ family protein B protein 12